MLRCRAGDVQALKALLAAEVAGRPIDLEFVSEHVQGVFGAATLAYTCPDGTVLTEPNVIAACIGAIACFAMCNSHVLYVLWVTDPAY